jgi:hypothetical protein
MLAEARSPKVHINILEGWLRHDVVNKLEGTNNIGIELGVAKGFYAKRMLESDKFSRFYGIDVYGDKHDTKQYKEALSYIGFTDPKYCLLRLDFENALDLFEDEYFDFIYVDGYAHTGEEGGKSLIDWYQKLKVGGILAGDDYHDNWPLVKWAVNDIVAQLDTKLYVTGGKEDTKYSKYPTWFIEKGEAEVGLKLNQELYELSMKEKKRIHSLRAGRLSKFRKLFS